MVTFSMTFTGPFPVFQDHGILVDKFKLLLHSNRKTYLTYGMVPCLMTVTDL